MPMTPIPSSSTPTLNPLPGDQGLLGWTFDPATAGFNAIPTGGTLLVGRMKVTPGVVIGKVYTQVATAGSGLTNTFVGLYDQAGNLLGTSANEATAFQSAGTKASSLAVAVTATQSWIYAAMFWTGTTGPTMQRGANSLAGNAGIVSGVRFGTANTGLTTALPSSLSGLSTASSTYWFAVGA